jgi:porphobilinogen synthase
MNYPLYRPRRLRRNEDLRRMIRETRLSVDSLVYPLFVTEGKDVKKPISSMPGICQMSSEFIA